MIAIKNKFRELHNTWRKRKFERNRKKWLCKIRARLHNNDFTIISNNCIAGVIYHDLNKRFDSPTINLFFKDMADFVLFLKDIDVYTSCCLTDVTDEENRGYPCGRLEPLNSEYKHITLCFMHYTSFQEAQSAWVKRCRRIHPNNIFIIYEFYNNLYDKQTLIDFDKLPYKNKIALVHQHVDGISCSKVVHCYKNDTDRGVLLEYDGISGKRFLDEFDYVTFLNHKESK